jgi:hypothetical protein
MKRSKGRVGEPRDLWSTPSAQGYIRDDNSLIKTLVDSARVRSALPELDGAKLSQGYVACHIWPMRDATDPWTNSFVPNLVWLPHPLAVLSDRDGHRITELLAAIARATYRDTPTLSHGVAEQLWNRVFLPSSAVAARRTTWWPTPSSFLPPGIAPASRRSAHLRPFSTRGQLGDLRECPRDTRTTTFTSTRSSQARRSTSRRV